MDQEIREKFERYLEKTDTCWLWKGARTEKGYGRARYYTKDWAHRVSYKLYVGEIPKGLMILHSCHVPCCVNPKHLRAGTAKENSQDMVQAGRTRKRGMAQPKMFQGHKGIGHTQSFDEAFARYQKYGWVYSEIHVQISEGVWGRSTLSDEMKARGLL